MNRLVFCALLAVCSLVMAKTVKISDFKPGREDATKAIQAALDSGADTVVFDNPGFPYLVDPLFMRSNQELVFQDGVEVRAIKDHFHGNNDCLFTGDRVTNVVMRGEGKAVLAMNKKDYQNIKNYTPAEWRHGVCLLSTTNVRISNLTILSSGGDGVYVSDSNKLNHVASKNTIIENCILDDHHRQGVSVIAAENLLVRNCVLSNTRGTAPQCGIDFEPNHTSEKFLNCVVENCTFSNNAMAGILVHCPGQVTPIDITFRNCIVKDNPMAMQCTSNNTEAIQAKGQVKFENVVFENNRSQFTIRNQRVDGPKVWFKDCLVKIGDNATDTIFALSTDFPENFGNVQFDNLRIVQNKERDMVAMNNPRGSGLALPPGTITWGPTEKDQPNKVDFDALNKAYLRNPDIADFSVVKPDFKGMKPATTASKPANTFTMRDSKVLFYQYVEKDVPVDIDFKVFFKAETQYPIECSVVDTANETKLTGFTFKTPTYTWHYKPNGTTVLRLEFNTHGKSVTIQSHNPGCGLGAYPSFDGFRSAGDLYFTVPAALAEVRVFVQGNDGEAVQIAVYDETGKELCKSKYAVASQLFKLPRKATAKDVLWKIKVVRCVEDYSIRVQAPAIPVFYTNPANALVK